MYTSVVSDWAHAELIKPQVKPVKKGNASICSAIKPIRSVTWHSTTAINSNMVFDVGLFMLCRLLMVVSLYAVYLQKRLHALSWHSAMIKSALSRVKRLLCCLFLLLVLLSKNVNCNFYSKLLAYNCSKFTVLYCCYYTAMKIWTTVMLCSYNKPVFFLLM